MLGNYNIKEVPYKFIFKHFGTFSGPQYFTGDFDFDATDKEGLWHTLINQDTAFKNTDIGSFLMNTYENYVGQHLDSVSTAQVTEEASFGNIPVLNELTEFANMVGDMQTLGNIDIAGDVGLNGILDLAGVGDVAASILDKVPLSDKGFDIEHPTKKGHRIRHICVEGPEDGPIYIRGKLKGTSITCPSYWDGLVDPESISVQLTPIGSYQELYVDSIDWGKKIEIRNRAGGPIECYYQVWAARKYDEKLHVEYKGDSPADYPGDNSRFSIAGYDYDKRGK
ncbi:hypothetical protein [Synechococcus phage S-B43]|jgi:hypothetical protein|nr:hypothetical protein [Synechococcus phage S-B43]